MTNFITKDTYDLWADNISYLISSADGKKDSDEIAESILEYLEGEGAFELLPEKNSDLNPGVFKAGQSYAFADPVSGNGAFWTVEEVRNGKAVFIVNRNESDVISEGREIRDILFDEEKNRAYVLINNLKGEEDRIYAKNE